MLFFEYDLYKSREKVKILFIVLFGISLFVRASLSVADSDHGKRIFLTRCAMCHGSDAKGTGPLANRSSPPTPDLTTSTFKKRLSDYPGVIVSSIILRPNGDLIPRTLRENGVKLSPYPWTIKDFRDLNQYLTALISRG